MSQLESLQQQLKKNTQGEVLFSAADRGRYATDASIYQEFPVGVFVPKTDEDVATALAICRDLKTPIVPRGGGTSQCGQTVGAGLVIDHSKYLRHITQLDLDKREVTVQPGMVLDHLNAQLKKHGLWFPVDVSTAAQATLGGMAGNNSCGSRSIYYGNMVHNVAGISAYLSDGQLCQFGALQAAQGKASELGSFVRQLASGLAGDIRDNFPKVLRRVAGYNLDVFDCQNPKPYNADGSVNLAHLLVGSEGTLALTQSLTLRLSDLPQAKVLGVVNFPTFYNAMDATQHIVKMGGQSLSAVELVDRTMIELALSNPAFAPTVRTALSPHINGGKPDALLLVEFVGNNKTELLPKLKDLNDLLGELGLPNSVVQMVEDAPQKNLWEVRKAGLNIMMSLKGDGKPVSFIEDCAVPLEHLAEYTSALTEVFAKHNTRGTWYAHASVGTLHVRPILDMRRALPDGRSEGAAKMRAIAEEAAELVRKYKGAYSGEHGDGLCRGEWIKWQFGDKVTTAFEQIKAEFDPLNLLCPRRMVKTAAGDVPKMDDTSLKRYPPSYTVIPIKSALDWQTWNVQADAATEVMTAAGTGGDPAQGLAKAVEMCNNNGHCRKFDAGTMCPSYRVTRDEQHVTRGRANTLRLAMSGQLDTLSPNPSPANGRGESSNPLSSEAVHQALDLCVSCKGCKRDCPTGVDMARMKVEATAAYKQVHGHTLRDKLIAYLPRYAPYAAKIAPLLNLRNALYPIAWVTEKLFGISAARSLMPWKSAHFFNTPHDTVSREEVLRAAKPVVLFADTFNGYFESDNLDAALKVLSRAGYSVHVVAKEATSGLQANQSAHLCCGRTYLATGMVDQAKASMLELLTALKPFADAGIAIVGLEPSCLLTLRDEALVMGLGELANNVSKQAMLIEEFLAREAKADRLGALTERLQALPAGRELLLHGHCHQKAMDVVSPVLQVLQLIPTQDGVGAKPQLIESSCCGMAGSFGYEVEHYDVSLQMAELSLLPAVRDKPNAIVVADGTSCRHQIKDGAAREAVHVVKLLADRLSD